MKKVLAFLLAAITTVSLMGGCSNTQKNISSSTQKTASSESKEKVVLKVWGGDLLNNKELQQVIAEKYPNISYEVVTGDQVKIMSMVAAGTAPDIWVLSAFHMGCMYASRGLFEPLDSYIAKSKVFKSDDFSSIENLFKWDGKTLGKGPTYGIVKDWSLDSQMWINKKVFTDCGIAIPDANTAPTWDQIAQWAQKMVKKNGGKQVRWGLGTYNNMSQRITFQLAELGSSMYSSDLKSANINTPEMKKVLQYWANLFKTGAACSSISAPSDANGVENFLDDEVGMVQLGYWFGGQIKTDDKSKNRVDNYMLIQSPVWKAGDKSVNSCLAGVGGAIYSGSKHKQEAFNLLECYLGGQMAVDRAKTGWGIPAIKSDEQYMPQSTAFEKQVYSANSKGLENLLALTTDPYCDVGGVESTFTKYFNQYLGGQIDIDQCIAFIQKDYDTMIKEGIEINGSK